MSRFRPFTIFLVAIGTLASTAAARAQEIRWRTDYNVAWKEARDSGRPLFVEVGTPTCTWCRKLHDSTFRDPRVIRELNDKFIPVTLDGTTNPKFVQSLNIQAFPALVFGTADGQLLGSSEGFLSPDEFCRRCDTMLAMVPPTIPTPPTPAKVEVKTTRTSEREISLAIITTVCKGVREQLAAHHLVQGQTALFASDNVAAKASMTKVLELGADTKAAAIARRHMDQIDAALKGTPATSIVSRD